MFHFPTNLETAKDVGRVLSRYKDSHYYTVLAGVVVVYILYPFVYCLSQHFNV